MDRITIVIETGNAAFADNPYELANVLRSLSERAAKYHGNIEDMIGETANDTNGNTVARVFGDVGAPSI